MLKVLSILHPSIDPANALVLAAAAREAGAYESVGVVHAAVPGAAPGNTAVQALPVRGRGRTVRYVRLRSLVRALRPEIIHVQASPTSLLALQAAAARRIHRGTALVLDAGHQAMGAPLWCSSLVGRRVATAAGAAIVPHHHGLRALAKAGFHGHGLVAGPFMPLAPRTHADRDAARARFAVQQSGALVLGFWEALRAGHGIVDVLEGVVACQRPAVLLVHGAGPLRDEIVDRAAALGAADRIRVLDDPALDPTTYLAALDCLVVLPQLRFSAAAPFDRRIAAALAHGVPVIASHAAGLGEMVGAGGWLVEPGDPGQLAGLLRRLADAPAEITGVARAALAEAARRCSQDAVMEALGEAFEAAHARQAQPQPRFSLRRAQSVMRREGA